MKLDDRKPWSAIGGGSMDIDAKKSWPAVRRTDACRN